MRVLVTRPNPDAAATAQALRALGHEPVLAPLLTVRFEDGPDLALDGIDAILATSANGVRAVERRSKRRDIPVFAVGPQSADAARAAGFLRVESADGDALALAQAIPHWLAVGTLFHAAGANSSGLLAEVLVAKGYRVESPTLYDVVPVSALSAPVAAALASCRLDAVLFYSPMSARIFSACVIKAALAPACAELLAVAISEATAKALAPLAFRQVRIAAKPNGEALLACLA